MSLGAGAKRVFFLQLAQLLRAGVGLPAALRKLQNHSGKSLNSLVEALIKRVDSGAGPGDLFHEIPAFTPMERAVLNACARSGRLDRGCDLLAAHLEHFRAVRSAILRKLAYPMFVLHFGVFALPLRTLFVDGAPVYLRQTLGSLAILYAVAGVLFFIANALVRSGAQNVASDALLRALPVVGMIRGSFAVSRFCAVYDIQLEAGLNPADSLAAAAAASRSGMITNAVQRSLAEVRAGEKPGDVLEARAFTKGTLDAIRIAESTGSLDAELRRLAEENRAMGLARMASLSEWIPRLIYCGVLIYLGWQIVGYYRNLFAGYEKMMNF
jgi:type II secretory pathway component PulF